MPYVKPSPSPLNDVTFRVAATAWFNHLRCRVRRCRRDGRCLGRQSSHGLLLCVHDMTGAELDDMLNFFVDTANLATPVMFAESLAQAKTDEEREMIEFRRQVFLYYHEQLAKEGLAQPLSPPFVEG